MISMYWSTRRNVSKFTLPDVSLYINDGTYRSQIHDYVGGFELILKSAVELYVT
jgi:hypothetical protein